MATGDYTTLDNVVEHAGIASGDTSMDTLIATLITAVSRAIDGYCRRQFYATTETRYYDFQDPWRLWLDKDLLSVTTLTNGNGATLTENTDFYLFPYSGPPYRRIDIKQDSGELFQWSGTPQRAISVAGDWGYSSTTPADIQQAATSWVTYLLNSRDFDVRTKKVGDFTIAYANIPQFMKEPPAEVKPLLAPYRFTRIGSIAL